MTTCTSCRRFHVGDDIVSPEVPEAVGPLTVAFNDCQHGRSTGPRRDLGVFFIGQNGYRRAAVIDITTAVRHGNNPDIDGG